MALIELINRYQEKYDSAMREYNTIKNDKMQKYAYGKLQMARNIVDDLRALAELPCVDEANELLPLVSGWLEFKGNEKLFASQARKNCRLLFDDGSECNYNHEHPMAIMTHFKMA